MSNQTDSGLKIALDDWAHSTRNSTERALIKEMLRGVASISPIIDRFSLWMLAGTGATAALMATNLDKLLPFLTKAGFSDALHALIISWLFGILSKFKAIQSQSMQMAADKVKNNLPQIIEQHQKSSDEIQQMADVNKLYANTEIDLIYVFEECAKAYPSWLKPFILKKMMKSLADAFAGERMMVNYVFWQSSYAFLQSAAFIWFLLIIAMRVS